MDDRIFEVVVADCDRVGITECGRHHRTDGPLADAGQQPQSKRSVMRSHVGPLVQVHRVAGNLAQCPGTFGFDAQRMKPPSWTVRKVSSVGRKAQCRVWPGCRFAQQADKLMPLPDCLSSGDPLPKYDGQQIVIEREAGAESDGG